jgi:hypothetical protein
MDVNNKNPITLLEKYNDPKKDKTNKTLVLKLKDTPISAIR